LATLSDIKRRIRSVRNTEQITRAMKMIAGTRLRQAQARMLAMRPYKRELARAIAGILPHLAGDEHTLLEQRTQVRRVGLFLVTPDRGLCGGLPGSLIREGMRFIDEKLASGTGVLAYVSGRKGRRALRPRKDIDIGICENGDSERPTGSLGESIAMCLADAFEEGRVDEVYAVYGEFRSAAAQIVRRVRVLPVDRESLVHDAPAPAEELAGRYAGAEFEPDLQELVEAAIRRHLGSVVYGALLEGAASELGARLTAMDAATKNAGDLITELTLAHNKARQAAITNELMDIVGGVEAMR
jgi:F-type H+-transporting ATPase subunit gamma